MVAALAHLYSVGEAWSRSFRAQGLGWLWCGLAALSCSGPVFTSTEASGGAAGDGSGALGGSAGARLADGGEGGAPTDMSDAGASPMGEAGEGNSPDGIDCSALHGEEFGGHCYVDATVDSSSAPQAVLDCAQFASEHQLVAHLLVLDSVEEQSFVLKQFLVPFTDVSDAWLGLTCTQLDHPDINDCTCLGCSKDMLAEKQLAWAWFGGAASTFGWATGNPNDSFRCAALGYNPETTLWAWVDRPCEKSSHAASVGHTHGYRTLCELEP